MHFTRPASSQTGQVGLIVLLVIVIVATIGLSVASRSSRDLVSTRQNEEASQTFAAAESAIEKILSQPSSEVFRGDGSPVTQQFSNLQEETNVEVRVTPQSSFTGFIREGETVEIDISSASPGNELVVEWAKSMNCTENPASFAGSIIQEVAGSFTTRNFTWAPCDHGDNFTTVDTAQAQNQGSTYAIRQRIALESGDKLVRLSPVYSGTDLLVQAGSGWTLTPQQFSILSTGRNQAEGGRETQVIQLDRSQPMAPSILDFSLVSGTTITHPE